MGGLLVHLRGRDRPPGARALVQHAHRRAARDHRQHVRGDRGVRRRRPAQALQRRVRRDLGPRRDPARRRSAYLADPRRDAQLLRRRMGPGARGDHRARHRPRGAHRHLRARRRRGLRIRLPAAARRRRAWCAISTSPTARASQRALAERNEALEQADRVKSEFIANVSYELRTPLNTIIGFAEILNNRYFGALNTRQAEYSEGILEASKRLLSLINDILDLATIEAGRMELEQGTVEIPALDRERLPAHPRMGARAAAQPASRLPARYRRHHRRRAAPEARAVQSGLERRQVHAARRRHHDLGRARRRQRHAVGHRHRHRHRQARPSAHLREVRARQGPDRPRGRRRARPGAGPEADRAARRRGVAEVDAAQGHDRHLPPAGQGRGRGRRRCSRPRSRRAPTAPTPARDSR